MSSLEGLLVVELAEGWAGSLCGKLLAELGAEVVKVESPLGDRLRSVGPSKDGFGYAFELANAGKEGIVLDLEDVRGQQALRDLLSMADVVIETFSPGYLASKGLGYDQLRARNPGLTFCSITPFGQSGPLSRWAGNELIAQATSGLIASTGYPDQPPMRVGVPLGECAGALYAATGILAALYDRSRTGMGQAVDIALHDALVTYECILLPYVFADGKPLPRMGSRHPTSCPWNLYRARDGSVVICTATEPQFVTLAKLMGRPDLLEREEFQRQFGRRSRVDEVDSIVEEWTSQRGVEEIVQLCDRSRIPAGPVADIAELLQSSHFRHRQLLVELEHPVVGSMPTSGPLYRMSESPGEIRSCAPMLGQHTQEVLSRLTTERPKASLGAADPPSSGPLEGLRVADLTQTTAGMWGTLVLADLGAEVIKVEPPGGIRLRLNQHPSQNGVAVYFNMMQCGKKGVTLDLGTDQGRELFQRLIGQVDVVAENFGPDTMDRWGVGYERLRTINPGLIHASVKGFGQSGPYKDRVAYDTMVQSMAGLMSLIGWPGGLPTKTGVSAADVLVANVMPVAVLAALHERRRSGKGQLVDLSLYDATAWTTQEVWPIYLATGKAPSRIGNRHHYYAPYGVYQARDGLVAIAVETDEQWLGLLRAMGDPADLSGPEYASATGRLARVDELDAVLGRWVAGKTAHAVVDGCQSMGVPAAPVLELDQVIAHPHTLARQMIATVEHPVGGTMGIMGCPVKLSASPWRTPPPSPAVGAHNREVYGGWLGLSEEELERLQAQGII